MQTFQIHRLAVVGLMVLWIGGCAGSRESEDASSRSSSQQNDVSARADRPRPDLAAPSPDVRTIQLYPTRGGRQGGPQEAALPIISLGRSGGGETLTLEFDLVNQSGRPLSVYFYHADRQWRRDLSPSEYLEGFQRDNVIDYASSQGTEVRYTHYTYRFPNGNIDFLLSGNYIVRVTEQGNEEEVLFERAFFISEEETSLEFFVDDVMVSGRGYPSVQPIVRFRPPGMLSGNVFDFNVCFVRNGRVDESRCTDQPDLSEQPYMLFYLQPEHTFTPQGANYYLDLRALQVGPNIERTDFSIVPYSIVLKPDYARFAGSGIDPLYNGQPVISRVRGVADPDVDAEYVNVQFRFVPPNEERVPGGVVVTGSFNNWAFEPANQLDWVATEGHYRGEVLLKQGEYEYRYASRDGRLERMMQGNLPRRDNAYVAFVYYADVSANTDRLLAFGGIGSAGFSN